jgi:GNAT superfamily N-acetyltransferase
MTKLKQMQKNWMELGVDTLIVEYPRHIKFYRLVVDKRKRGIGLGTLFMKALILYADTKNKRIDIRPSLDFGGSSLSRLKKFYKRFGFIENKGRDKISGISETMYRHSKRMKWGKF